MSEVKGNVSFLLGSGFSIPEGLCSVSYINEKVVNTKAGDFYLYQDQSAGYYIDDVYRDPNEGFTRHDRILFEDVLEGYVELVLGNDRSKFNYEEFFEFTNSFHDVPDNAHVVTQICDRYRAKLGLSAEDMTNNDTNLIFRVNNIYEQLVADLLDRPEYWEDVSVANYPPYDHFIEFITYLLGTNQVNVHTLNHDLFFDFLGKRHANLFRHYCDGYTERDSNVFGNIASNSFTHKGKKIYKRYKVRLRHFADKFDKDLRLFKLHGSIDTLKLYLSGRDEALRVKKNIGVDDFQFEEIDSRTQKYTSTRPFVKKQPDYLTGRAFKIRSYDEGYYKILFDHFKENLKSANVLIVIGYGFKDEGINDYIEKHYLSKGGKVIVIDKFKPEADIITKYTKQFEFHLDGVTGYSRDQFIGMLGS